LFFTVIIPTCDQSKWIEEAVNGILNQSFDDFELIISDDSENDETLNLITRIKDERLIYFKNSPSYGRVKNYRTCILERARGQWGLICDGDDFIFDSGYLETCYKIIIGNPNLVMIQAGHNQGVSLDKSFQALPSISKNEVILDGLEYFLKFNEINHFSHISTVSNLSFLKKLDPFRKDILSSDIETYLRLAYFGDVCILKKSIGLWRQHGLNASATLDFRKHIVNADSILDSGLFWKDKITDSNYNISAIYKNRAIRHLIFVLRFENKLKRHIDFLDLIFLFKYLYRSKLFFECLKNKPFIFQLKLSFSKCFSN
jgi:glycosyltransferase involved in cell wall biosynthesis